MQKLFSLIQVLIIVATISICTVSLTIIIPIHEAYSQQQLQQLPVNVIFKMVANSTVGIITNPTIDSNDDIEYDGTGFVYDAGENTPYIVTNAHVVQDFETVEVRFIDGSIHTAMVEGVDPQGDIAVLRIVGNITTQQQQPPTPLAIANSSELQVGEQVIAIGNPFIGDQSFANLLTTGVISKLGVEAVVGDVETETSILNAIVTDAATAGGSSGGPLLNLRGEVVGMNTAGDDNTPCCSYAIPSNTIKHIVPTLIKTGEYIHPWIGLEPLTLNNIDPQSGTSIPSNPQGVIVSYIIRDGPAHKAGIKGSVINQFDETEEGDIITAIDGKHVTTVDEFNAYIDEHKFVGDNVVLSIYRNGQPLNVRVTLEENPYWTLNTSSTTATAIIDILTYQNSSYGIKIQYPANWTKDEGDFDPNDDVTDIVEFSSPSENTSDSEPETLGISIEELTDENRTLDEYANSLITDYKKTLTGFNLVESDTNNSMLSGRPAYKLVYTDREDDTNYKTMEIGTIIGDKVYYIEYIAEEERYTNYLPTIQMMINSFEIT